MAKNYVNSKVLEEYWIGWQTTGCDYAWEQMSKMIYKVCEGVATHFNPPTPEDYIEHVHDAFFLTMDKIHRGRIRMIPGKAPVFNLLTTTIFRHLYSKMNKEKKRKQHLSKYIYKYVSENHPEMLSIPGATEALQQGVHQL